MSSSNFTTDPLIPFIHCLISVILWKGNNNNVCLVKLTWAFVRAGLFGQLTSAAVEELKLKCL